MGRKLDAFKAAFRVSNIARQASFARRRLKVEAALHTADGFLAPTGANRLTATHPKRGAHQQTRTALQNQLDAAVACAVSHPNRAYVDLGPVKQAARALSEELRELVATEFSSFSQAMQVYDTRFNALVAIQPQVPGFGVIVPAMRKEHGDIRGFAQAWDFDKARARLVGLGQMITTVETLWQERAQYLDAVGPVDLAYGQLRPRGQRQARCADELRRMTDAHTAVHSAAEQGQYADANRQLEETYRPAVHRLEAILEWHGYAAQLNTAEQRLNELQRMGATELPALRYRMKLAREHARREDYTEASRAFKAVGPEIQGLYASYDSNPQHRRWARMNSAYLSVSAQLDELKVFDQNYPPPNGALRNYKWQWQNILTYVDDGQFKDACDTLDGLLPLVNRLHTRLAELENHALLEAANHSRYCTAESVPSLPALDRARGAFETATIHVENAFSLSSTDNIRTLRDTKLARADALILLYQQTGRRDTPAWERVAFYDYEDRSYLPALMAALREPTTTPQLSQMHADLRSRHDDVMESVRQDRFDTALQQARQVVLRSTALEQAAGQVTRAAKALHQRYEKSRAQIEGIQSRIDDKTPPLTNDEDRFMQALAAFQMERQSARPDITACFRLLATGVEPALDKLLRAHVDTLKQQAANADTAALATAFIDQTSDWELACLPSEHQVALLQRHRESWSTQPSGSKEQVRLIQKHRRATQRKIYKNMHMDEDFLEHDREKRALIVAELKNDRALKAARTNWDTMDWDDKKEILQKVANAECRAFNFDPVPVITLADLGGSKRSVTNGYFDPNTKSIVINVNPASSANDFERAVDLIIHENAHYYQDQLCEGLIDPTTRDPRLNKQVEMFKLNNHPASAYVTGAEHFRIYQRQPLEAHAHLIGPATARDLLLHLEPEEELDMSGISLFD